MKNILLYERLWSVDLSGIFKINKIILVLCEQTVNCEVERVFFFSFHLEIMVH